MTNIHVCTLELVLTRHAAVEAYTLTNGENDPSIAKQSSHQSMQRKTCLQLADLLERGIEKRNNLINA
jgi:hypothetical protein